METPCVSSVLMGALTVAFIIADYYFNYGERVLTYIFLGSTTTILFYVLCLYGYQMLNWVFLGILPIYVFFSILSIHFRKADISDASDMCDSCELPEDECECKMPKPKPKLCGPTKPKKPKCKK
jgi:hypothetical protein